MKNNKKEYCVSIEIYKNIMIEANSREQAEKRARELYAQAEKDYADDLDVVDLLLDSEYIRKE